MPPAPPLGPYHGLEAGVQLRQEWGLVEQGQDSLLHHGALHVVILNHYVLLEDFDGVQLFRSLPVGKHHLRADRKGNWKTGVGGRAGLGDSSNSAYN